MKKIYSLLLLAVVSLATLNLQSCEESTTTTPDEINITSTAAAIIFSDATEASQSLTFNCNTDWSIEALAEDSWFTIDLLSGAAGDNSITVSITDASIAYIDQSQTVTITAGSASVDFEVVQYAPTVASAMVIETPQRKILLGQELTLTITTEPLGAPISDDLVWDSSDPSVISIDENGTVTGLALGVSVINADMGVCSYGFEMEVTEIFTTDSTERVYTFADLAEAPTSGVVADGTVYTITTDLILSETDVLTLGDATNVKLADDVLVTVKGLLNLVSEDRDVTFEPVDASAQPQAFYLSSDIEGGGEVSGIIFENCMFRYFAAADLTFTNCTFENILTDSAISLGGEGLVTVEDCDFLENGFPAVSCAANFTTNMVFKNNYVLNNSSSEDCSNKPQLNLTVPGDGTLEIIGNTIIGPSDYTTCGGLAFSNFYSMTGEGVIRVEGNTIQDCRYGLTTYGTMNVEIVDNVIQDNKWDESAMSGGSGMSLVDYYGGQSVYLEGNTITGNLWGITIIGYTANGTGPSINLGCEDESSSSYNPGGNVFSDNGNGGVLYDLYNNSPVDVYAQGNTWGVDEQTEENIESVIFHKNDNDTLGQVFFMPAAE